MVITAVFCGFASEMPGLSATKWVPKRDKSQYKHAVLASQQEETLHPSNSGIDFWSINTQFLRAIDKLAISAVPNPSYP